LANAAPGDGDVNGDHAFDGRDVRTMMNIVRGLLAPTSAQERRSDVAPIGQAPELGAPPNDADLMLLLRAFSAPDLDADGLSPREESAHGTSPLLPDTDRDGFGDAIDVAGYTPTAPAVPDEPRVTDAPGNVTIDWEAPDGAVDHYVVHRYDPATNDYRFEVLPGSSTSYVDTPSSSGVPYLYWVQAFNALGQAGQIFDCDVSDPFNTNLWMPGARGPLPNPFSTATPSAGQINLSWEQSTNPATTGYKVWLASSPVALGSTAGLVQQSPVVSGIGNTTYAITGLSPGLYFVRVTAFSSGGSVNSTLASARQLAVQVP
jgi:hypothetical protein